MYEYDCVPLRFILILKLDISPVGNQMQLYHMANRCLHWPHNFYTMLFWYIRMSNIWEVSLECHYTMLNKPPKSQVSNLSATCLVHSSLVTACNFCSHCIKCTTPFLCFCYTTNHKLQAAVLWDQHWVTNIVEQFSLQGQICKVLGYYNYVIVLTI